MIDTVHPSVRITDVIPNARHRGKGGCNMRLLTPAVVVAATLLLARKRTR